MSSVLRISSGNSVLQTPARQVFARSKDSAVVHVSDEDTMYEFQAAADFIAEALGVTLGEKTIFDR
ncbi:MAG: hypothetical protein NUW37_09840 [Planctomycetes bacterium]|nr:hypothetical protein [Planctomycetota bacterium]